MVFHDDERIGSPLDTDDLTGGDSESSTWDASESNWRGLGPIADEYSEMNARQPAGDAVEPYGTSTISRGTSIKGALRSQDPLHIDGEFTGEIFASGDVMIAPGASVNARVQAIRVTIAGSFEGAVACTDRFEVLETGSIRAQIFAPIFIVHDGATINGEFRMRVEVDDDPGDEAGADDENQAGQH